MVLIVGDLNNSLADYRLAQIWTSNNNLSWTNKLFPHLPEPSKRQQTSFFLGFVYSPWNWNEILLCVCLRILSSLWVSFLPFLSLIVCCHKATDKSAKFGFSVDIHLFIQRVVYVSSLFFFFFLPSPSTQGLDPIHLENLGIF